MKTRKKPSAAWSAKATTIGERLKREQLHPTALAWAASRGKRKTDGWCVAFSGGVDSLALLLLMWTHWPERRAQLTALHFNHRLRGRESDRDEQFCREVCAALGVKIKVGRARRARAKSGARLGSPVSEAELRRWRHDFFAKAMGAMGSKALWLAHQQDDIAETMLMRLARGSGTAGLAAPRPVQPMGEGKVHLRPLLSVQKEELRLALKAAGASWREDSSNVGEDYFRNRIRRRVLPAWVAAAGRDAVAGAALARERLEEDDMALAAWVTSLGAIKRGRLEVERIRSLPRAVVRRTLHAWMLGLKEPVDLSRQGFERLLAVVEKGAPTRFSLSGNGFAVLKRGELRFERR